VVCLANLLSVLRLALQHDIFDRQNQKTFQDVSVAEHYADMTALFPPELRALEKVRDVVRGRPIMDIGVGTGRTAPKLLELSTDYVGIDYSPEMIAKCRIRFPGVRFAVGDARRLDNYDTAHFALLMFSLNGIDYVRHSDRLVILRECHRLLDDGGVFLFSSHNELWDMRAGKPLAHRTLGRVKDGVRQLFYAGLLARMRDGPAGHSYRCDEVFGGKQTLITYYITPEAQIEQLLSAGFVCNEIFNSNGDELWPGIRETSPSPWLYYLARKSTRAA